MKRLLLALFFLAPGAVAAPWSVLGAQPLPTGTTILSLGFGFPSMRAGYTQGISESLDAGLRVGYGYLWSEGELGASLRWRALEIGEGALAVRGVFGGYGSLGLTFYDSKNTDDLGLLFAPGVVYSLPAKEALLLSASVDVPMAWTWGRGGGVIVPLLFGGAVDLAVDQKVNVGATFQIGPRWDAPGERLTRTRLWVEGQLWTSVKMF